MKMLTLLFVVGCFAFPCLAQTRVMVGGGGGVEYNNMTMDVLGAVEQPLGKRFEMDALYRFTPFERKTEQGSGVAQGARLQGITWRARVGIEGGVSFSEYQIKSLRKDAEHVFGGVAIRALWLGAPNRFFFEYVREVNNRLVRGVEPSHLQGFRFANEARLGCAGKICTRFEWEIVAGRVLTQSNPQCDGSLPGPVTCARVSAWSGGAGGSFRVEFPRRRSTEYEVF